MAIVYMATNKINGKRYIGVTKFILRKRVTQHFYYAFQGKRYDSIFYKAIRKYHRDDFSWSILFSTSSYDVALKKEVFFIKKLNPEYNITLGGEGSAGRKMSDYCRKKLHAPKSKETREKLRKIGLRKESKKRWNKYAHLGPKASAKKVVCIDDGKIFESASSAARHYGSAKSALIELCLGKNCRKTVNGRRFSYIKKAA